MSDQEKQNEIAQLTLKHIQDFRNEFAAFARRTDESFKDLRFRVSTIERQIVHISDRLDSMDDRMNRIEKRLDLVEA